MRLSVRWGVFAALATALAVGLTWVDESSQEAEDLERTYGDSTVVTSAYNRWAQNHEAMGGDRNFIVGVGWSKGLSTEFTSAQGIATLDLIGGTGRVELTGLSDGESVDVWLVDNRDGAGRSVAPEEGDAMMRLGRVVSRGGVGRLDVDIGAAAFETFDVDVVTVTHAGKSPVESRILAGVPSLFQRLHASSRRGQDLVNEALATTATPAGLWPSLARLATNPVFAQTTEGADSLVERGRNLFFNETFRGNGRTCGTCHPASANLTIDPTFISTLGDRDPLFVAEFIPALATGFENPTLMRKVGLILENVDGFVNPGVMRGVPHTLALPTSLTPVAGGGDGTTIPPVQRTGWGGDGAPGSGALRDFATGAVTQHFPLTLGRVNGVDFRLPNDAELDAMEAFQLSLGRQGEIDLRAMVFKNAVVDRGKVIFNNAGGLVPALTVPGVAAGKCFFCHLNAGATDFFFPGQNANFNTNVEGLPDQPADLIDPANNPPDGGFGSTPNPSGGFGNGTFNTPPLIEAADTGPFFHNNAIETIEESVNFYNSDAFNNPPGFGANIGGINLQATEVVAVAAMLRVLNSLENIDEAIRQERTAATQSLNAGRRQIQQSIEELQDAIEVLRCGRLHPVAIGYLEDAIGFDQRALLAGTRNQRNNLLNQAIALKGRAKADMVQ